MYFPSPTQIYVPVVATLENQPALANHQVERQFSPLTFALPPVPVEQARVTETPQLLPTALTTASPETRSPEFQWNLKASEFQPPVPPKASSSVTAKPAPTPPSSRPSVAAAPQKPAGQALATSPMFLASKNDTPVATALPPPQSKRIKVVDPLTAKEVSLKEQDKGKTTKKGILIIDPLTRSPVVAFNEKTSPPVAPDDAGESQDDGDNEDLSSNNRASEGPRPAFDEYEFADGASSRAAEEEIRLVDLAKKGNEEAFNMVCS